MARCRRQAPAISLFSFQDIVTSVMGIMLIVTLLLALDLIHREARPVTAAADDSVQPPTVELTRTIARLDRRKKELIAAVAQSSADIAALGSMSAEETKKSIQTGEREADRLHEEIEKLEKHREDLEQMRREQAMLAPQIEREKEKLVGLRETLEREQARLEAVKQDTRLRLSIPRGDDRSGWLIDLKTAAITVVPLGPVGEPIVFIEGTETRNRDALLEWLRHNKDAQTYLFVVVRPRTTETFYMIRQAVDSMGIQYGFDVVGENQSIVVPHNEEPHQ